MKTISLACSLICLILFTSAYAVNSSGPTANEQNMMPPSINHNMPTATPELETTRPAPGAPLPNTTTPSRQRIDGVNASGSSQTTIIDANGNLKMVKPGETASPTNNGAVLTTPQTETTPPVMDQPNDNTHLPQSQQLIPGAAPEQEGNNKEVLIPDQPPPIQPGTMPSSAMPKPSNNP